MVLFLRLAGAGSASKPIGGTQNPGRGPSGRSHRRLCWRDGRRHSRIQVFL